MDKKRMTNLNITPQYWGLYICIIAVIGLVMPIAYLVDERNLILWIFAFVAIAMFIHLLKIGVNLAWYYDKKYAKEEQLLNEKEDKLKDYVPTEFSDSTKG